MKLFLFILMIGCIISCKKQKASSSETSSNEANATASLPTKTQQLWSDYLKRLEGKQLQKECIPLSLGPKGKKEGKGLVIIYHGFTGCPNQFINIARELVDEGYHVLLPLLPGNGRIPEFDRQKIDELEKAQNKPINEIAAGNSLSNLVKDDYSDIPLSVEPYYEYADTMTNIALSYPGPRVIVGLSLGGGLAVATLIRGAELAEKGKPNVWERGLLVTPFFKAPSVVGNITSVAGFSVPRAGVGFGASCESEQLRTDYNRRIGICDFALGNIRTLQQLGSQIGTKEEMGKIKVPVQVIGVANDQTSDNTSIIDAFNLTDPAKTQVCFFPDEVSHATFFQGDFVPLKKEYEKTLTSAKEVNQIPRFSRYWARYVQDRTVNFIVNGFDGQNGPFALSKQASTEANKSAKRCELEVDLNEIKKQNQKICADGNGFTPYCNDLDLVYAFTCDEKTTARLPAGSQLKTYCNNTSID